MRSNPRFNVWMTSDLRSTSSRSWIAVRRILTVGSVFLIVAIVLVMLGPNQPVMTWGRSVAAWSTARGLPSPHHVQPRGPSIQASVASSDSRPTSPPSIAPATTPDPVDETQEQVREIPPTPSGVPSPSAGLCATAPLFTARFWIYTRATATAYSGPYLPPRCSSVGSLTGGFRYVYCKRRGGEVGGAGGGSNDLWMWTDLNIPYNDHGWIPAYNVGQYNNQANDIRGNEIPDCGP